MNEVHRLAHEAVCAELVSLDQVPLLIGITMRGAFGDQAKFHQSNGLYLEPVMKAIDIPYMIIDRAHDIPRLAVAYRHSRTVSRPVVVGFTRELLRGEA